MLRPPNVVAAALLLAIVCVLVFSCSRADAHPVACSAGNAHYQDMNKSPFVKLKPKNAGVVCGTHGPRTFVFKIVGPCHTYFQTIYVLKETNILGLRWSATYRYSPVLQYGWNRCKPR